jgi:polysaccharide biosynthesis protein PslG
MEARSPFPSLGRRAAMAVLATLAVVAGISAGSARAALPRDFVGVVADDAVNGDPGYRAAQFGQLHSLGVRLLRVTFDWAQVETSPGNYDFSFYDGLAQSAAENGIELLPVVFDPPRFRSGRPRRHAKRGTYFPKHLGDLGTFAALVAGRYGPGGSFWTSHPGTPAFPIAALQVWNEPNLPVYDPAGPSARHYERLLKAVYPKVKRANRRVQVATAGLPDSKLSRPNLYRYIDQLYRAGGKRYFDILAVNPYAASTKDLLRKLSKVRKIMRRRHDSRTQMWLTEMGWSDKGPRSPFRASRIRSAIPGLAKASRKLRLRGFVYYSWRDGAPYAPLFRDFWGLHTGLLRINGTPKPAYNAFRQAVARLP